MNARSVTSTRVAKVPLRRIGDYQAIQLQPLQGFTHRRPPDAEVLGEVVVIEEIAWLDVQHQQPVPDALVGYVRQRLPCRIISRLPELQKP